VQPKVDERVLDAAVQVVVFADFDDQDVAGSGGFELSVYFDLALALKEAEDLDIRLQVRPLVVMADVPGLVK